MYLNNFLEPLSTAQAMWDINLLSASSCQFESSDTSISDLRLICALADCTSPFTTMPLATTLSTSLRTIPGQNLKTVFGLGACPKFFNLLWYGDWLRYVNNINCAAWICCTTDSLPFFTDSSQYESKTTWTFCAWNTFLGADKVTWIAWFGYRQILDRKSRITLVSKLQSDWKSYLLFPMCFSNSLTNCDLSDFVHRGTVPSSNMGLLSSKSWFRMYTIVFPLSLTVSISRWAAATLLAEMMESC